MTKIVLIAVAWHQILSATFSNNTTWRKMWVVSLHGFLSASKATCLTHLINSTSPSYQYYILYFYFFLLIFVSVSLLLLQTNEKNTDYFEGVITEEESYKPTWSFPHHLVLVIICIWRPSPIFTDGGAAPIVHVYQTIIWLSDFNKKVVICLFLFHLLHGGVYHFAP